MPVMKPATLIEACFLSRAVDFCRAGCNVSITVDEWMKALAINNVTNLRIAAMTGFVIVMRYRNCL